MRARLTNLAVIARATTVLIAPAALLGSTPRVPAQDPTWLREFGASGDEAAFALLPIAPNSLLLAGSTHSSLFGPGSGGQDVFLAWFDDAGSLAGGVQFGTGGDTCAGLAPGGDGAFFAAGSTTGSLGAQSAGGWDAWLARCDGAGNRLWIRQLGSTEWDFGGAVAADGEGGVIVAGTTYGGLAGTSNGVSDVWIARYDADGRRLWLIQLGTSSNDSPRGLVADGDGGVIACGTTLGNLAGVQAGNGDAWIARFDSDGNQVWARQFGTSATDAASAINLEGGTGFLMVGYTGGNLGAPNAGPYDIWFARYDGLGNQLSMFQFGTSTNDWPDAVCPDGLGGAFVAGSTSGSLGGPSAGLADVWVAHIRRGTTVEWIDQFGSSAHDAATALAPGNAGTVFAAGYTYGTFAPGGGGFDDAWLARYDICYPDCNADGVLTVPDFGCFQTRFITADLYADCNADGALTVSDFGCFQTKFVTGCP